MIDSVRGGHVRLEPRWTFVPGAVRQSELDVERAGPNAASAASAASAAAAPAAYSAGPGAGSIVSASHRGRFALRGVAAPWGSYDSVSVHTTSKGLISHSYDVGLITLNDSIGLVRPAGMMGIVRCCTTVLCTCVQNQTCVHASTLITAGGSRA